MSDTDIIIGQFQEFKEATTRDIEELKQMHRENSDKTDKVLDAVQKVYQEMKDWQIGFEQRYSKDKEENQKEITKLKIQLAIVLFAGSTVWGLITGQFSKIFG